MGRPRGEEEQKLPCTRDHLPYRQDCHRCQAVAQGGRGPSRPRSASETRRRSRAPPPTKALCGSLSFGSPGEASLRGAWGFLITAAALGGHGGRRGPSGRAQRLPDPALVFSPEPRCLAGGPHEAMVSESVNSLISGDSRAHQSLRSANLENDFALPSELETALF